MGFAKASASDSEARMRSARLRAVGMTGTGVTFHGNARIFDETSMHKRCTKKRELARTTLSSNKHKLLERYLHKMRRRVSQE